MAKTNKHVVPSAGGWSVRSTGSSRAAKVFVSRDKAVEYGRTLAKKESSSLYIHGKDGSIRDVSSYARDPYPPTYGKQARSVAYKKKK